MSRRILVVEDDPSILRGLELNLQLEGYAVDTATDGEAALVLLEDQTVDLVILDLMLPKLNGYEVLRELRRRGDDVPVLVLSARGAEADKVMGLDLGADDYVSKPFGLGELLARVKAHLRRRTATEQVRFDDVVVDFASREVRRAGEVVPMTRREFDLLELLLRREGRALTRETILAQVWGHSYFGTTRTVDNFITRLRQKVDRAGEPRRILTVRGVGYRFVLDEP